MGPARHLALLPGLRAQIVAWPVPFADGLPVLLGLRGRRVVMLATGDPFWFGAGTSVAKMLAPGEWETLPGVPVFSLAASRMGWGLEEVVCLGLHAAPLARLRPHLADGVRVIVLLRDGAAVEEMARYLVGEEFGASRMTVLEALGGPRERVRRVAAAEYALADVAHPVAVALEPAGGRAMSRASGLADDWFAHDGQITKRPVRALTLSALAPKPGELLWDIGGGSGSVGIEWMLSDGACRCVAVEADPVRAERLVANAARLGVDRLKLVQGRAPEALAGLPVPDAVFVGGGVSQALLEAVWDGIPAGCRVVCNAVTLESEALLAAWHGRVGGSLLRIDLSEAGALGARRGWKAAYPVVQWSVVR